MGSARRPRPKYLGEKLLFIRTHFDYSLAQMADKLPDDKLKVLRTSISQYELNDREPSLPLLLRYARMANITIDVLADDEIDLSDYFPVKRMD